MNYITRTYFYFTIFFLTACFTGCSSTKTKEIVFENISCLARVTGDPIQPGDTLLNPNNTVAEYNVGGTDLGIVWEVAPGKYGIFFGDTYGNDFIPNQEDPGLKDKYWKCNILAFSEDKNLEDGLTISGMVTDENGHAREIIYGAKDKSGTGDWTSIPTAAIKANGKDYVHYMNIRTWENWVTNYSGIYSSDDNGFTWEKCDITFTSDSNFGQAGYYKKDGYVYMIATQTGRSSNPRLARFREKDIEDKTAYEFWNGVKNEWIKGDEEEATNLFEDTTGELSFIYNTKFKKWIITYFCAKRYDISVRYADEITGPWSEPQQLVSGREYSRLYGSYIHPLSADADCIYFLMSMWYPYNVFLMKANITTN